MQSGEYISDRWLIEIVRGICEKRGIRLKMFSDDWIMELVSEQHVARVIGYKFELNNSVAAQIASDKVAASQIMHAEGVPVIAHSLVRTKIDHTYDWSIEYAPLVVKPLTGTSGHGIRLFDDQFSAEQWMRQQGIESWAVSPFVDIVCETRLILLGNEVLLAYDKIPQSREGLVMFNLGRGASPRDISPTKVQVEIAQRARQAIGLRLCAVDLVETREGEIKVLEVNDGIMMEYYMRVSSAHKRRACTVYERIIDTMLKK